MGNRKNPSFRVTPTPKGDKALRLIMQKYGYTRKSDAVNASLIDRASHISKAVQAQLEAMNEQHDTMEIASLKQQIANLTEMVSSQAELINKFIGGGFNVQR